MADDVLRVLIRVGQCLGEKQLRGNDNWSAFLAAAEFCTEQPGMSERRILEIFRVGRKTVRDCMTAHRYEPLIHLTFTQPDQANFAAIPEVHEAERQPFETIAVPVPDHGIITVVGEAVQPAEWDQEAAQSDARDRILQLEHENEILPGRNAELEGICANGKRAWIAKGERGCRT